MRKELSPDEKFMKEALRQARKAYKLEEAPIGCVIVYEGKVIARGYNRRNIDKSTLSHAEILESVGLDVPQATKLLLALKSRGFDVDCGALTVDEALEQIKKLYHN